MTRLELCSAYPPASRPQAARKPPASRPAQPLHQLAKDLQIAVIARGVLAGHLALSARSRTREPERASFVGPLAALARPRGEKARRPPGRCCAPPPAALAAPAATPPQRPAGASNSRLATHHNHDQTTTRRTT